MSVAFWRPRSSHSSVPKFKLQFRVIFVLPFASPPRTKMSPEELNRAMEFITASQARLAAAQEQDRQDRIEFQERSKLLEERQSQTNQTMAQTNQELSQTSRRLSQTDQRLSQTDQRLSQTDQRLS